ncbi:MAG: DUF421 domain-containing protein [Dehalococcoidia bacterium]|nr:DUF421 domain-containing protein [Dehalococcoidia bacterium]
MDVLLRGAAIYLFLLLIFRISGPRALAQITTFDFVLLLIIAEAVQQGLLGDDFSVTTALLLTVVLIGIDIAFSWFKDRSPWFARTVDGVPLLIVDHGELLRDRMDRARIDEEDVLTAARSSQGLSRMDEIDYAVLERNGAISIIPRKA